MYQLLHYQAFLPLLLGAYTPGGRQFFSHRGGRLSHEVWEDIVREISPALMLLSGAEGYSPQYKESWRNLFGLADSFLGSSDEDSFLSPEEIGDTTVHILEGLKNSRLLFEKLSHRDIPFRPTGRWRL